MTHSYEELRAAAFDVLAGRVKSPYEVSQYAHFKIGVARALQERENRPQPQYLVHPSDSELDPADAETFREIFWDLFRQGVITLGMNDANPQFPWFRLTTLGKRVADGENGYFVHDVQVTRNESLTRFRK